MTDMRLFVLGYPRLELGEKQIELETRKAMAMLLYLAVTDQSCSRDFLSALFWPDYDQTRARTYLRRALWMLKKATGENHLIIERERLGLKSETGLWLDVAQFHQLINSCEQHNHPNDELCIECLPLLAEAAELYQGDFLTGFTLSDSYEFDDWQFFQSQSLRQELASVLKRLVQGYSAQREYEVAIPYARRWMNLDALNEAAHRELMRLYTQAGRRHEALRQYKTCSEILATELGGSPDPETETLYQKIISSDLQKQPVLKPKSAYLSPAPITVEIERSAPLVGRKIEFETLQAKISKAWLGQGCTILLAGDSGVGKTRLAYELLRDAAQSGITSLMGAAYEQEGHLAYQPFIEAIDRYLVEQQLPLEHNPITHYIPIGSSDPQQEHTTLFRKTATFFTNLATEKPVILMVDDLHAADDASLSLFHYLVRQTRTAPVILLATYRTDIAVNSLSPFGSLLNALYREGSIDTIDLMPLTETDGTEIVNHTLEGQAEETLVKAIFDLAEGNPFFIQEITRAMLKTDFLSQVNGKWRLLPGTFPQVPAGLQDLLRDRARRLGSDVETTLTAAAVMGREFRFSVLHQVTGLSDGDLFDTLDVALDARLLEETDNGYRFQHGLIRQTLYDLLSHRRRIWLHTRIAEAIETTCSQQPDGVMPHVEALAFHYDLSDRRDKALPYMFQAAQKAADLFALEVANDYLERALDLMDELGVQDPVSRWPILEKLGMLATILADTSRAVTRFEQALALPSTDTWQPEPGDQVRLHRYASRTLITAGRSDEAERHLHAAIEIMGDSGQASLVYAHLLYDVALWHWHNNKHQEAFETAQRSLDIAEQLNDDTARAQAYEMLALACHSLGEWQQGLGFEEQRSMLVGPNLDVTEAFDIHL